MKIEEEARKFMQDKLFITEIITPDLYERLAGETSIFPKEKALEKLHSRMKRGKLSGSGDNR